jgi:hypothetical protein
MSKSKRRRSREVADRSTTTDVVSQLECAIHRPQATLIGALVGGLVPWFARTLAHVELPAAWAAGSRALALAMIAVVIGCAIFSGLTVYKFGRATFGDSRKALGFTLALEGVMLVSHGTTSAVALAVLIAINALANGAVIALARDATCRRREADERRAATRARTRAEVRAARMGVTATTRPASSIPVVDVVGAVPRSTRSTAAPALGRALIRTPVHWHDDAIDAEIVSEERLLS